MAELNLKIVQRAWWKHLGVFGVLIAYLGLKAGVPVRAFFRFEI